MTNLTLAQPAFTADLGLTPNAKRVLVHLKAGKTITPNEALVVYSIGRLASCIHEIRRAGYSVKTENRQDEQGHKYGRYSLVKPASIN